MYNPELRTYLFEALGWGWGWGSTSVVLPSWSSIKIPVQYRVDCRVESVPAIFWCFCSVPIQFIFVYWIPPNAQSWRLLIWACCNLRGVKILIFQIDEQRKHQTQIWPLSVFELRMEWIFTLSSSVACPLYSKSRQDSCWRSCRCSFCNCFNFPCFSQEPRKSSSDPRSMRWKNVVGIGQSPAPKMARGGKGLTIELQEGVRWAL